MRSIYNETACASAAEKFDKHPKSGEVTVKEDRGDQTPTGCSWHRFGNLELWKFSRGQCNERGWSGCFCEKIGKFS